MSSTITMGNGGWGGVGWGHAGADPEHVAAICNVKKLCQGKKDIL